MSAPPMPTCPLCLAPDTAPCLEDGARVYHACARCDLYFLDAASHLSLDAERERYLLHRNDVGDPGYRDFVRPLYAAVSERLAPGAHGLDFGCGRASALGHMLESGGYAMRAFDPHFAPDPTSLARSYDFVVACEVVEHLSAPHVELARLRGLLRPGGWLGIMTLLRSPGLDFATWYYRRDPTHVAFYSERSFEWIRARFGFCSLERAGERVVLLRIGPEVGGF
jgi:SAM-dependent methyltransferase